MSKIKEFIQFLSGDFDLVYFWPWIACWMAIIGGTIALAVKLIFG